MNRVNASKTIRVNVGESLTEALQTSETNEGAQASSSVVQEKMTALEREKIEALAEIICGAGNQSSAALLVLMSTLASSTDPKPLTHAAKHFAFTRCGELNLCGMVEAQIAVVESELWAGSPLRF